MVKRGALKSLRHQSSSAANLLEFENRVMKAQEQNETDYKVKYGLPGVDVLVTTFEEQPLLDVESHSTRLTKDLDAVTVDDIYKILEKLPATNIGKNKETDKHIRRLCTLNTVTQRLHQHTATPHN